MDAEEIRKIQSNNMRLARIKAAEFFRSDEGKVRRKELAILYQSRKPVLKKECETCSVFFETKSELKKYCSNKCKSSFRRKNGRDDEISLCGICGKEFYANKYATTLTCSTICTKIHKKGSLEEGYIETQGYRVISRPSHANARHKGKIFEHVFVMSEYLGRPIRKGENVHHKNGIRNDNRIENLELWHRGQPPGQRVEDKIAWAKEFLEEYGYKVTK